MNNIKIFILASLSFFFFFFFTSQCSRADVLELKDVYIDYRTYFPGGSDPIINEVGLPDRNLDKKLDIHINLDIYNYIYWNNMINSTTDKDSSGSGQFRVVGWEMALGLRLCPVLDIGYYHHSQHILDNQGIFHYPVEDAIQFKIYLFQKRRPETLINM